MEMFSSPIVEWLYPTRFAQNLYQSRDATTGKIFYFSPFGKPETPTHEEQLRLYSVAERYLREEINAGKDIKNYVNRNGGTLLPVSSILGLVFVLGEKLI